MTDFTAILEEARVYAAQLTWLTGAQIVLDPASGLPKLAFQPPLQESVGHDR